jgi:tRNA(fMet)-specific endonuclease VapC
MILLDTDTLTLYFKRHPRVVEKVQRAEEVPATSIVTRIEVLQGRFESVLKAANADQLLAAQERLEVAEDELAKFTIVPFDVAAATEFDRLRENKKLKKIGRKDLLIAAIALAHSATFVTRNLRDFRQVPGLRLENWAD